MSAKNFCDLCGREMNEKFYEHIEVTETCKTGKFRISIDISAPKGTHFCRKCITKQLMIIRKSGA